MPQQYILQFRYFSRWNAPTEVQELLQNCSDALACVIVTPLVLCTRGHTATIQPADQPADQLAGQPADQLAGQPADQPADQLADQPADQPADQLAGQPADQPAGQTTGLPAGQTISLRLMQPPISTQPTSLQATWSTSLTTSQERSSGKGRLHLRHALRARRIFARRSSDSLAGAPN